MTEQMTIPARFNGPPASANGGYCCGALAAYVGGAARVRLTQPPPLETALAVVEGEDGAVYLRRQGQDLGTAWPVDLHLDVPATPDAGSARAASRGFIGFTEHALPTCFVCGTDRAEGDGLRLFPGPVAGTHGLVACTWTPHSNLLDSDGMLPPEIVWSALDCPGYFAAVGATPVDALLGELSAELLEPIPGDQELIVFAWPIEHAGRKRVAGTALADHDGTVLARARSIWIELKAST